jgi:hypothetical protein
MPAVVAVVLYLVLIILVLAVAVAAALVEFQLFLMEEVAQKIQVAAVAAAAKHLVLLVQAAQVVKV